MSEQRPIEPPDATAAIPQSGDPTLEPGSSWLPSSPDLGAFAAPGGGATPHGGATPQSGATAVGSGPSSPVPPPPPASAPAAAPSLPHNPFAPSQPPQPAQGYPGPQATPDPWGGGTSGSTSGASSYPPYGQAERQGGYGQDPGQPYGQSNPPYGAAPSYAGTLGKPWGSTSSRATAVLVLGIASIPGLFIGGIGFITAIVALVLAPGANREVRQSGGALTGESQVRTGRILAIIALVLSVLFGVLIAILVGVMASHSPSGITNSGLTDTSGYN